MAATLTDADRSDAAGGRVDFEDTDRQASRDGGGGPLRQPSLSRVRRRRSSGTSCCDRSRRRAPRWRCHVTRQALEDLRGLAETYAVLGNNDHDLVGLLQETRMLELAGVRIALVHDSGATKGRARRLYRRFPNADLVVFGHSHVPVNEVGEQNQIIFNPGSPTQRRSQPHRTFGRMTLAGGPVQRRSIEILD